MGRIKGQFENERIRNNWPEQCPVTGLHFFMGLEHPTFGLVPTFGGPFDSYTTPIKDERDEEGENWTWERYDHDEGAWVDPESVPEHYINNQNKSS